MTGGWVQIYRCWCSDSRMDEAALPDACPGHQGRVLTKVANTLEGGVPDQHACAWRACPDGQAIAYREHEPDPDQAPGFIPLPT